MNRETWLNEVATKLLPTFGRHGYELTQYRVAVGFPSTGRKGRRIGECWDKSSSNDGVFEIFIRPDLDDPVEVAQVLTHELCHAAVGIAAGHGPLFRKVARAMLLEGKLTATVAGAAFKAFIAPVLEEVGALPHARLNLGGIGTGRKTQTNRQLKCVCPECGYIARTTSKWIDEMGPPHCPEHGAMEVSS